MGVARKELGISEAPGAANNPRIVEYHAVTRGGKAPDRVPWCSSAACWVMETVGLESPRSKAAISWMKWGVSCRVPLVGSVGVIRWHPWSRRGHVLFVLGVTTNGRVVGIGGNQGDAWSIKSYPRRKFADFRWPTPPTLPDPGTAGTR